MKKKITIVVLTAILLIAYFFFVNGYQAKSIEEALDISTHAFYEVVHVEDLGGSYFVVSKSGDYLHTAVVNHRFGRYKTLYNGIHGEIEKVAEVFGVTDHYFPGIKYVSKPILYGVIGDSEVSKLELYNSESQVGENIKILENHHFKLWIKSLENTDDIKYVLKAYNEKGEKIIERDLKFAPREIRSYY
jgi:hypothetical protein